jgi:hypothetical protein
MELGTAKGCRFAGKGSRSFERKEFSMKAVKHILGAFAIVLTMVLAANAGTTDRSVSAGRGEVVSKESGRYDRDGVRKAPWFSSPQVYLAPNGDRVSRYPPYYHPDK